MPSGGLLEANEAHFRHLVQLIPDAVFLNENGGTVFANTAAVRLLRAESVEQLIGLPRPELWRADFRELVDQTLARLLARPGREAPADLVLVALDGTEVPVEVRAVSYEVAGQMTALAICRDISDRQRADAALRREHAYADAVLIGLPGTFYHFDAAGRFVRWNRNLERVTGYTGEEIAAMRPLDFFPEDQRERVAAAIAQTTWAGEGQVEADFVTKDGRRLRYLMTGIRFDQDGEQHVIGIGIDVDARRRAETALRDERDYADRVLNSLPGVFYQYDADQRMVRWNHNMELVSGYRAEELAGTAPQRYVAAEDHERLAAWIDEVFRVGSAEIETELVRKDGTRLPYYFNGVRFDHDDRPGFMGLGIDIGERVQAEAATRQALARMRSQADNSDDGVLVVDPAGRRVMQNRRMAEIWGIPPEIVENPDLTVQFEFSARRTTDPELFRERIRWLERHPEVTGNDQIELVDGTFIERYSVAVSDAEGDDHGRLWIYRDVTERRRAEQRLRHLATRDQLTGLPNRGLLQRRLAEAIEQARGTGRHVVLLDVDLDRFKVVNDSYGHPFGDAVIAAAAARLSSVVGGDGLVARHGGDEFVVLLPGLAGLADAYLVAERILTCLESPLSVEGHDVHLAASIGLSAFPGDGDSAQQLIDNADVAMYRAKAKGGGTVAPFTHRLGREIQQRTELERGLRVAAELDQLSLVYQPKVSLLTGEVTGCEALLRWHHPQLGSVPPSEFIPVAEDSGLIVPIGDWVLHTACLQAVAWQAEGLAPVPVAVNLSARQLRQDLVSWVSRALRATGLPADRLELELTESVLAHDVERLVESFARLRELGVRLAIDDFGTGYSSLAYLRRLPIDTLKVDRSFVTNVLTEPEDEKIVQAIISLARAFDVEVVAEGVETPEQLAYLRQHGCAAMQGFLFSKPLPPEEFAALLRSGRRL
ncbi:EAL domain-containing protein [Nocardioides sp.]|uniref:bifunctional diguanylate cyclase/phosphodiesterase n=1 Tax=Nocardioides sp. TaxID=35761 RepID=UPI0039E6E02B